MSEDEIRVLLVDDEAGFPDLAAKFLEKADNGLKVDPTSSPYEALEKLEERDYDAVVSDYQMPGMSGLELLETVREQGDDIPFIIFTGRGREEVAIRALNLGADRYIQKGGDPKAQFGVLAQAIIQEVQRYRTKLAVEESRERYKRLFQETPHAIFLVDAKTQTIKKVNQAGVDLTGYDRGEIIDTPISEVMAGEPDEDSFWAPTKTITTREGEEKQVIVTSSHAEADGLVQVIVQDVTGLWRVEKKLRDREKFLSEVFASVKDGISVLDDSLTIKEVNPTGETWFAHSMPLVGKKCYEAYVGREEPCEVCPALRTLDTGETSYELVHRVDAEGDDLYLDLFTFPMTSSTGDVEGVIEYARDVTEHRARAERIQDLNSLLSAIRNVNQLITVESDVDLILEEACEELTNTRGYLYTVIATLGDDGRIAPRAPKERVDWRVTVTGEGRAPDCVKKALRARETVVVRHSTEYCGECSYCVVTGPHKTIAVPMLHRCEIKGVLLAAVDPEHEVHEEEKSLLEEVSADLALGIEKIKAEEKLRESEEKFREIFNNVNDALFLHEITEDGQLGRLVEANDIACERLGYTRDEFAEMTPEDVDAGDMDEARAGAVEELLENGHATFEMAHVAKDDTRIPVEINAHVFNLAGKEMVLSVARDITERKETEEALRESEKKFRGLTESATCAICIYQDERFVYVNPAAEKIIGYSRDELLQMRFWDVVHPDHKDLVRERGIMLQRGEDPPRRYEFKIVTKDGESRWIDFTAAPIEYRGRPAGIITAFDVTERKQAEKKLRESQRRFNLAAAASKSGAWEYRIDEEEVYLDSTLRQLLDSPDMDRVGIERVLEIIPDEDREMVRSQLQSVAQGEEDEYQVEHRFMGEDGSVAWVSAHGVLIRDEEGEPSRIIGMIQDITSRKQATERLERYKRFYKSAKDLFFVVDARGRFTDVNPRFFELVGYSHDELVGSTARNLIHPDDLDRLKEYFYGVVNEGESKRDEFRFVTQEGKVLWLELVEWPIFKDDRVVEVEGIVRDITKRKKAEENLKANYRNQEVLNNLLHLSLQDYSLEEMLNKALEVLFDVQWLSIEGKGCVFMMEHGKLSMKAHYKMGESVLESCQEVPLGACLCGRAAESGETVFASRVDGRHDVQYDGMEAHGHYCVPIKSEGKVLGVLNLYVTEGHERDRKEIGFLESVASVLAGIIERKETEKREKFLHSLLRHDLTNKLQIVEGYQDLLRDEGLTDEQMELLERASNAAREGSDLIQKIREIRKAEQPGETRDVRLAPLLSAVASEKNHVDGKNIGIEYEVEDSIVHGGPLLREVFSNLLENAITHSSGSMIRVSVNDEDEHVVVSVEDDGVGVPDDVKDRIFERGYKGAGSKGSGLGLHLARIIAEGYGGRVEVGDSELGGAKFDVYLRKAGVNDA